MPAESVRERFPRLLAMVAYLARHGEVSLVELADHFAISLAQVRKDLETLWVSGLPGQLPDDLIDFTFSAQETHVSLREGLGLERPLRLTPRETITLIMALAGLGEELDDPLLRAEIDTLITTLRKLVPAYAPLEVAGSQRTAQLRRAIRNREVLGIEYVSADDVHTIRTIDPLRLLYSRSRSYLVGYCHDSEAVRVFALHRIAAITPSGARWQAGAADEQLAAKRTIAAPNDGEKVVMTTDPQLRWLAERLGAHQKLTKDGKLQVTASFYSAERLVRTVLAVADKIETIN
ncbi:MAG: WYL domain-containing protein, partial [Bowdeniella nasicola]|nr:WYL domain-containing protein [Bowdeniella nasicola]